MSTIATIQSTDIIANSRADLNTNFANLNADKVEGPAVSVDSEIALFSGTGGKTVKRASGTGFVKSTSGVISNVSSIVETDFAFTDMGTANASSSAHGLLPKTPANSTQFLNGGTGPSYAQVKDSDLALTDIVTNDSSTGRHGFLQKLPGDSSKFFRGDGTFAPPSPVAFKNGTTTKNVADADATQTITHGLGTTPKFVRITAVALSGTALAQSISVYNGTTQSSQSSYFTGGGTMTSDSNFRLNTNAAAVYNTGVITFDATNISIAWTKNGSPTGTYQILWEVIG